MLYLALGDSISIDYYTGVPGGGAACQFAQLIRADKFVDLTYDGCTTDGVIELLASVGEPPDVATLTAGGNDFIMRSSSLGRLALGEDVRLLDEVSRCPLNNLRAISEAMSAWRCPVIINTVYDPTDGDDSLSLQMGIDFRFREQFNRLNSGIRQIAVERGFLLADLEELFRGHGIISPDPWITRYVEPNYAGATAIAKYWLALHRGE